MQDAVANAAQMVKFHAFRDRASGKVVREDMSPTNVASANVELAVAVRLGSTFPNPTWSKFRAKGRNRAVLIDLFPETLLGGSRDRHKAGNHNTKREVVTPVLFL